MNRTVLHYAAAQGNLNQVRAELQQGIDANARDRAGWTPLHFAAQAQAAAVAQELLAAGATVDPLDQHGNTPLWHAVFAYRTDPAILQILLSAGADPDLRNAYGVSPRTLAARITTNDATSHLPSALTRTGLRPAPHLGLLHELTVAIEPW